ncbi:hypothetical protein [Actinomadura coerulea]
MEVVGRPRLEPGTYGLKAALGLLVRYLDHPRAGMIGESFR